MTSTDPTRAPGYRGALPPREDRLARPWIITVMAAFVLIMVLSVLGIPSRFIPEPTPIPLPSLPLPSGSFEAVPSGSAEADTPSASPSVSAEPSPSPTAE